LNPCVIDNRRLFKIQQNYPHPPFYAKISGIFHFQGEKMEKQLIFSKKYLYLLFGILVLLGLYLSSLYNYLLFHSLAELFSIVVACGIFMIAWNSRRFLDNNYLLLIGIAYLFVGGFDLIHTLAYKGMNIFQGYETNLPTQLWISARYMESLSLLIAPLFLRRKLKVNLVFLTYAAASTLLLLFIFYWDIFPTCFIEGIGLTPFKKISEYIISLIFLASIVLLLMNRRDFDKNILQWVVWSITVTIASELAFTFYIDAYGFSNLVGHCFKILSFYFIYKALIETGLSKPYDLLFRNLKKSEEILHQALLETKQRQIEVSALLNGSKAVLEHHEFKDAAQAIFDSCKNVIGATAGYISLLSEDGKQNEVVFLDSGGLPCTVDPNLPMPIRGLRAEAHRTGKTIYHNDFPCSEYMKFMPEGHSTLDNVLFAPLTINEKVIGLLGIANKPSGFTENDARMASGFGELAAIALHNSRTLEALEHSEERNRSVVQTANDAIISVDSQGHIIFWNKSAELTFGYSFDEVMGRPLTFIMPERFRESHQEAMSRVVSTGKSSIVGKTVEMAGLRKDGSEFPIELSLATWGTREGIFFTGIIRDITERKKAKDSLQKSRDELEIRVQERTTELEKSNQALQFEIEERKQAEEALWQSEMKYRIVADNTYDWEWWRDPEGNFIYVSPSCKRITHHEAEEFIKDPDLLLKIIHPDDKSSSIRHQIEVEEKHTTGEIEFRILRPDGSLRWIAHACQPVFNEQHRFLGRRGSNRDITERKEIEKRIEATNALLNLFVRMPSRKDYLDAALELIQNWSSCRYAGIRVLNEKDYIPYESYRGFSRQFWESENLLSVKYDQCACIRVVTGNPDPQDHPMMTLAGSFWCNNTFEFVGNLSEEEKARFRGVCVQHGFKSVAIIPIRYHEKILGTIHLADEKEGIVPLRNIEFLESMAPLIGEAVNGFNLEEELHASETRLRLLSSQLLTVQEAERKRIAREIHDSIGQTLAAIKFGLESKLSQMGAGSPPPGISIENIVSLAQNGIEESRRIQMDLRPSVLDDLGILATIGWFTREFQKVYSHISVEKQISVEENEIPDSLKTVLFRVLQEAMNNAAKHSKADLARLILRKTVDKIELSFEDNGEGFNIESSTKGLGLTSMRERTELSGGSFAIESTPGKGTTIKAYWPL
jgi:PAS domain S-box-containing protein